MLRLMTDLEKNTSWIPYEKYFMTEDDKNTMFKNTKPHDSEIIVTHEILNQDEKGNNILPPSPPSLLDTITVTEQINHLSIANPFLPKEPSKNPFLPTAL